MCDFCKTRELASVTVQENGIIRNNSGYLIARLVDSVKFESKHLNNTESTKVYFDKLQKAIGEDLDYAWSWHCNVAMSFHDEYDNHELANKAAARFMMTAFKVDTTKCKEYMY